MNDITYFIILIILTIFILFYGGHNNINTIVYDRYKYFDIYKKISIFDNKFNKIYANANTLNERTDITDTITHFDYVLPNINKVEYIKLKGNHILEIDASSDKLLLIYNFTECNLDLIIDYENEEYLYELKKFNIVKPSNIYNNSVYSCEFVICEINKPFWYF